MTPRPLSRAALKLALVPRRPKDHKGTFGHVLVVAGSRGMAGAAILTTRAALRSGAGLVTLALPESLQSTVAGRIPAAMTIGLPERKGVLGPEAVGPLLRHHAARGYSAMALGPGLSSTPATRAFVIRLVKKMSIPSVIDADALNCLAGAPRVQVAKILKKAGRAVFTPHPGEMARCLGLSRAAVQRSRASAAMALARWWGGVTLLKGQGTLISDGKKTVRNVTGGTGLSKGGSGDILTGLIAGLLAQMISSGRVVGDNPFLAAVLGAHLHGSAGDIAARRETERAVRAEDILAAIPAAFRRLQ